ncbi:hypothetical protein [Psychrobacter pygoscelis]|uniref:hypothetical protein n=1 Tax=Psychrobacter pygoscelis TaxID=2488563 RepID=UPI00103A4C64|nr:hypothetical protein [Psychrobacter pygoscelis]
MSLSKNKVKVVRVHKYDGFDASRVITAQAKIIDDIDVDWAAFSLDELEFIVTTALEELGHSFTLTKGDNHIMAKGKLSVLLSVSDHLIMLENG